MNEMRWALLRENAKKPAFRDAAESLRRAAEEAAQLPLDIQDGEHGNWGHYYYCPDDAARLSFDLRRPLEHPCPVCGKVWTGEPFNGAWVSLRHSGIGTGIKKIAFASRMEDSRDAWRALVKDALLQYAAHYDSFEVHGDIPYNGPGKLFAQTLDEAHWIIDLVLAYRCIEDKLDEEARRAIREGLFRPCAAFLIAHKESQLHNHAVLITSAIAMLGVVLGDDAVRQAGLEGEYGLLDQLDRGVLPGGFWYEGAFTYHYYAFDSVLYYCMLVEYTDWELHYHPAFRCMFDFPLNFILPDGSLPRLNDASSVSSLFTYVPFYELAYGWYGEQRYVEVLRRAYGLAQEPVLKGERFSTVPRNTLHALLYGCDLEGKPHGNSSLAMMMATSYSSSGSGLTKLVLPSGAHLLVKISPFGGEHDHMDRLGLSFGIDAKPIFEDIGTTAYGVPMHYAWYKHTYSHNTVCLNGQDQPPVDAERIAFQNETWGSWVVSEADWRKRDYHLKNNITLPEAMCPWDEQAYRGAVVRRLNVLHEQYLIDVMAVQLPDEREIEVLYHMSGDLMAEAGDWRPSSEPLSRLAPELFENKRSKPLLPSDMLVWSIGGEHVFHAVWSSEATVLYTARTPDNPPTKRRTTVVERAKASGTLVMINVFGYGNQVQPEGLQLKVEADSEGWLLQLWNSHFCHEYGVSRELLLRSAAHG
ncbi:heparinase II/III domain-containing protein [Paenibacillus whitsoniae]|uniref:Heparinase II/III-like C-terminal domain-containing protein n=1 Tax=Paenibacillus whitsoniae TaxID=2496558 RepID=A0A430JJJ0_9BACL|nr:heparinase II/III family protein [Paenibacillus whitsoniae]RTE11225.1 hypothetical protein EJQ19_02765 [Paenibacillus whitsoniae]